MTIAKIVGKGHIVLIDKNTINFVQYGVLENGSAAIFSENLTRVNEIPVC